MVCTKHKYKEEQMSNEISVRNTIVLKEDQAALVIKDDGTIDLVFPESEQEERMSSPADLMAVALGYLIVTEPELLMDAVDYVTEHADALEEHEIEDTIDDEELLNETVEAMNNEQGTGEETTD